MSKSAAWKGFAGLGKGMAENAKTEMAQANEVEKMDYAAMKEEALARVRQKLEMDADAVKDARQAETRLGEAKYANVLATQRDAASSALISAENRTQAKEAMELAAVPRTSTSNRRPKERFKIVMAPGGQDSNWEPIPAIEDQGKGKRVYKQQGDMYVVMGHKSSEGAVTGMSTSEKRQEAKKRNTPTYRAREQALRKIRHDDLLAEITRLVEAGKEDEAEEEIGRHADEFGEVPADIFRMLPQYLPE